MYIDTGSPSFIAGENLIFLAAAIARSVKPNGRPETARMFVTSPLEVKTARNTTVPTI
jgi:hypothetical protein